MPPAPVAVIFHRLGPYHWARLDTAGRDRDLLVIEEAADSAEYAWDRLEGQASFRRLTLFQPGEGVERERREMAARVWAALERERPAAVAVPGWTDRAALAAIRWCTRPDRRVPVVMMSESTVLDFPRVAWKEWLKRRVVGLCGAGLVGGTRQTEYLVQLGMPADRIFTGYGTVDNAHFAAGAEAARRESSVVRARLGLPERYFVTCNRLVEKKNLFRLLEAYADYVRGVGNGDNATAPWDLVLLGDGPLRGALEARAEALGVRPRVHFPGFQQYDALPAYYGLAGAYVHVSTSEQWGLVVNEAMSAGLPVAVSDRCGCVPDLVAENRNGFALDPLDVPGITRILTRLAGDPAERQRMGEASREIIRPWSVQRFSRSLGQAVETARELAAVRPANPLDRLLLRGLLRV